jgi:hypothetical protein
MTEKQKRIAIIAGTAIAAILLLLFLKKGRGTAGLVEGDSPFDLPAVYGPNLGPIYNGGEPFSINIPGLDLSGPDLSMIGACCSDCMQAPTTFDPQFASAGNTYVFNAPDQGPSIYNYYAPAAAKQTSGVPIQFVSY